MVILSHLFLFLRESFRGRCDSHESHLPLFRTIYFPTAPYFMPRISFNLSQCPISAFVILIKARSTHLISIPAPASEPAVLTTNSFFSMLPASGIIISEKPWFLQETKRPWPAEITPQKANLCKIKVFILYCLIWQRFITLLGHTMHDQLMHCHRILPREASAGSRQNSSENHPMYTQDKAISQDTGFAPKQDIWLCPVTKIYLTRSSQR